MAAARPLFTGAGVVGSIFAESSGASRSTGRRLCGDNLRTHENGKKRERAGDNFRVHHNSIQTWRICLIDTSPELLMPVHLTPAGAKKGN
jgi:hypothetical protein